jgi:hypothetical protein
VSDPFNPAGLGHQHLALTGQNEASDIAETDAEMETIVRDTAALRHLASQRFEALWRKQRSIMVRRIPEKPDYWNDQIKRFDRFDVDLARRFYNAGFVKGYREKIDNLEKLGKVPRETHATIQIVSARHSPDRHTYEIDLHDPDYLPERIRFEVVVPNDGDAELYERD